MIYDSLQCVNLSLQVLYNSRNSDIVNVSEKWKFWLNLCLQKENKLKNAATRTKNDSPWNET